MIGNREILLKVFEITGNEHDSLVFLKNFKSQSREKFALIYVDAEIISEYADSLFYDIKILYQLDLFPILYLEKNSLIYLKLFYYSLYNSLIKRRKARGFFIDIIQYSKLTKEKIIQAIENKKIPIVIGEKNNHNHFDTLTKVCNELETNKLILLSTNSGLKQDLSKEKISIINLGKESSSNENYNLSELDKLFLDGSIKILKGVNNKSMSIAITSPILLLKELFTIKGSGTLIKFGSEINTLYGNYNLIKIKGLLESAFKKKVNPEFLNEKIDCIILESNYRGAAIMKETPYGQLLSKFAVDEIARGDGIGRDIWDKMRNLFPVIFWRAKPRNPINKWYAKECTGLHRFPEWTVYWINLESDKINTVCNLLRIQPPDFIE